MTTEQTHYQATEEIIITRAQLAALRAEVKNLREDADRLAHQLQQMSGVDTAAAFGATIHVCGRDPAALRAAVAGFPAVDWAEAAPTLEDVFIDLMRTAPDNSVVA